MQKTIIPLLISLLSLSGCNWVDATGRQSDDDDDNTAPETELMLDDAVLGDALPLIEELSVRIVASSSDVDGEVQSWSWSDEPVAEGNLDVCQGVNGFDAEFVADTLQDACYTANCSLDFDQQPVNDGDQTVTFIITAPKLRAPVGVSHELSAIDNDGGAGNSIQNFCLISMNEGPEAVDDMFTVLEGTQLVVSADDVNLLSNDEDDLDVRSEPLRVNPRALKLPAAASVFDLRTDGGFTYAFAGTNLVQDIVDTFDYEITDGTFQSMATVTLLITASNDPPLLTNQIPQLIAIAGIPFSRDLSPVFRDPENSELMFSIGDGALPASGAFSLSSDGIISGTALTADVGNYDFVIIASDGALSAEGEAFLTIEENQRVEADRIPELEARVGQRLTFAVAPFFTDEEDQPLRFALENNDEEVNLVINPSTGVMTGFITEEGEYTVVISVSDSFTRPTDVEIVIEVED